MAEVRRRRPRLVGPIILIGLGLVLLLQNFGLLPWSIWELIGRLWPLVLVLIGLELLLSRADPWLAAAVTVLIVAALIVGGLAMSTAGYFSSSSSSGSQTQHLSEQLGTLQRATIEVQFGAGELAVGSLGPESDQLMEGDFTHQNDRTVSRSQRCRDGDCTLRLASGGRGHWPFGQADVEKWQINLTTRVPLVFRLQSGASRLDLDLSGLRSTALRLDLGASSGTVKLPQPIGAMEAIVKAGAADLTVEVPAATAARIHARSGLSSFQIDEQRFPRQGDYYLSADYAGAANRVDLDVEAGVSTIRIN